VSSPNDPDRQFHENLRLLGARVQVPDEPSRELRAQCMRAFDAARPAPSRRIISMFRKPTVISGMGLAAAIAIAFIMLVPTNGGPKVEAAVIMQKLNEQIEQSTVLEIRLDAVKIDEVFANGHLLMSEKAVVADLDVDIQESDEQVEIDLSLALSDEASWLLIRSLTVSDPDAQAVLNFLMPAGTETLVLLPTEADKEEIDIDLDELHEGIRSEKMAEVLKKMFDSHEELGATLEEQPDGTVRLTLPIKDKEALEELANIFAVLEEPGTQTTIMLRDESGVRIEMDEGTLEASKVQIHLDAQSVEDPDVLAKLKESGLTVATKESKAEIDLGEGDLQLIGSTLTIVYDPATEMVRAFSIVDFGAPGSNITITMRQGEIDPALLDVERVKKPTTRVLDLGALEAMFEGPEDEGPEEGE
jgi:hypothetical protein